MCNLVHDRAPPRPRGEAEAHAGTGPHATRARGRPQRPADRGHGFPRASTRARVAAAWLTSRAGYCHGCGADGERYRRLVAFFTVRGLARLSELRARAGEELACFSIRPGSLVVLRAPGLGGLRDGRPFHAIVPVGSEERVSVALRMSTRPKNRRSGG